MFSLKNNKGITLILATALIFTLSILALNVLGISRSEFYLGQAQVDRLKAEQLAKGIFWQRYMTAFPNGVPGANQSGTEVLDGKTFSYSIQVGAAETGPLDSTPVTIIVTYNP